MAFVNERIEIERGIEKLLAASPYSMDPDQHQRELLALLKKEISWGCQQNPRFANYVMHWPTDFRDAGKISDLPYLPAGAFKVDPPLALVASGEIKHTLRSSSTSGQVPSRILLDEPTARRTTKALVAIFRDRIGPARRPYLVVDVPQNVRARGEMSARSVAIQGLQSFATELVPCLTNSATSGDPELDGETLVRFSEKYRQAEVLVYGFTFVIWTALVQRLQQEGSSLNMPNVCVLHSGGWKRLNERAVTKEVFNENVAAVFGCREDRIVDFYGMVENVGVTYPDCHKGYKHVPAFAEVIIRDPLTLAPADPGRLGLVQVCSALPTSFPGFSILTDDMGEIIGQDGCLCGRRGVHFRFVRRVPKAELRGCGNLETDRATTMAAGAGVR